MSKRSDDPSIQNEPHHRKDRYDADPSESKADAILGKGSRAEAAADNRVEHTVWDEPALSGELAGAPAQGELTYRHWLLWRRSTTTRAKSWTVTLLVALAAGPWAILGAFWGTPGQSVSGLITLAVVAPVVEETMKIAAALMVVERRPFLFRSWTQIALCTVIGGLVFAVVENLLYLHVYVPDPTPGLVLWRWTVCVGLHVGCSTIAGLGVIRVWRDVWQRLDRPRLGRLTAFWAVAVVCHGTYNGLVGLFEIVGRFF